MGYNSKTVRAVGNRFSLEVDQIFLNLNARNLEKVTNIREVMGRKRLPTLRDISFKFRN